MLYETFFEPCVRVEPSKEPDGHGGFKTTLLTSGNEFQAAIVPDTSIVAIVADSATSGRGYTVTAPVGTSLQFHDVIQRVSDGSVFRITSYPKDRTTPNAATFKFEQVTAEAWELPNG